MSFRLRCVSAAPTTAAAIFIAVVTAGCGGGGGSGSTPADANANASANVTVAPSAAPAASTTAPQAALSNVQAASASSDNSQTAVPPPESDRVAVAGDGYFVDSAKGSDSNAGTQAAPWKTLAKVMSSVRMQSAQTIYLSCGSVWRESMNLTEMQLADGATITAYGRSCSDIKQLPRITGADAFGGGWTKSGQVWQRAVTPGIPKIKSLTVNGTMLRTAQWPNFTAFGAEYAKVPGSASSSNIKVVLSDEARTMVGNNDLRGARILMRTEPWLIEERTVLQLSQNKVDLQAATAYPVDAGDGFIIQDKLWLLDAPGEFYHDDVNGMLYVIPPTLTTQSDLNTAQVDGSVRDAPLVVHGTRNVTVSKISVDMSTGDGMTVNESLSAVVDQVVATNNAQAGIRVNLSTVPGASARGVTVRNSSFSGNGLAAIDADNVRNADILGNSATQTGTLLPNWSNAAIIGGYGAKIDGNTIEKTAFRGILFSAFGYTKVSNNVITEYCQRLSDCAAIYTNSQNEPTVGQSSSVEFNRIEGGVLNVEGTTGGQLLAGIYLDDLSRMVNVNNNTLVRVPIGIYVHNSSDNHIEGNKVWLSTDASLMANMDRPGGADLLRGNTFRANQLVPAASISGTYPTLPQTSSSRAFRFWHAQYGTGSLTSGTNVFAANQVVAFNGDTSILAEVGRAAGETLLNAAAWKTLNPGEAAPSAPIYYANYRTLLGAELLSGGDFESGLGNWATWFSPAGSGGMLGLITDAAACSTKCARVAVGLPGDRFSSPLFNMVAGQQYVISFKARFVSAGSIAHPNIANPSPPYTSYIDSQGLKTSNVAMNGAAGETINYEAFFTAASSNLAILNLRVNEARVPVDFDMLSLRPVSGYAISNFGDWGTIVSAPVASSVNVDCSSFGWSAGCSVVDIDGAVVQMPTTIAAGQSRMLLLANSSWRR